MPVLLVEPGRAIVIGGVAEELDDDLSENMRGGTWAFVLKEVDPSTTRLLVRIRWDRQGGLLDRLSNFGLLEPSHFVMERRMMLGIKHRAEALAAQEVESIKAATATSGGRPF